MLNMDRNLVTSLVAGSGIMNAGLEYMKGQSVASELRTNASIFGQNASMIGVQQGIVDNQYYRAMNKAAGTSIARTAKSGFAFGGSPMAVMLDTQTQMEMDRRITKHNLEMQKIQAETQQKMMLLKAKQAVRMSKVNMFTSLLTTAANVGLMGGFDSTPKMTQGGVKGVNTGMKSSGAINYGMSSYPTWSPYK